jgi:hypothetical protein
MSHGHFGSKGKRGASMTDPCLVFARKDLQWPSFQINAGANRGGINEDIVLDPSRKVDQSPDLDPVAALGQKASTAHVTQKSSSVLPRGIDNHFRTVASKNLLSMSQPRTLCSPECFR